MFVGEGQHVRRNADAKGLGRRQIDEEFQLGGLHHGEVCRGLAPLSIGSFEF
jgi:hypothetical protein